MPSGSVVQVNKPTGDGDVRVKFDQTLEPVYGRDKAAEISQPWPQLEDLAAAQVSASLQVLEAKS